MVVKGLSNDSNEVEARRGVSRSDVELCFIEKERSKVWKDYVEKTMNEENDWDHNVERNIGDVLVYCVCRDEVVQVLREMKTVEAPVLLELIAAIREVGIQLMTEV